ncbi:bolA-like protein 1 [[Candida] railenensis]|uniref:BolA-like protein 1 n=1 Tax=[Candida] railenensis TaxID=45579 RepID=A0A9P0QV38_9ASCO|nr:bolA-like protein 1 [[Candida] railenensis]
MSTGIKLSPSAGPIERKMVEKLTTEFQPKFLSMENDSHKHAHHAGIRGATNTTESHFNLEIVSDFFVGKNMPTRHRLVYGVLSDELKNDGVHALSMKTRTPEEYEKRQNQ